jgi:hypothetical protein
MLNLSLVLLALCADPAPPPQKPERLSVAEAAAKVAAHLRQEKPKAKLGDLSVIDATTGDLWERLRVQVVKVKTRVAQNESFVVQGDKVFPIGRSFGGDGVTSIAVTAGERPLLVYAFAWGSGEHRSQLGAVDVGAKVWKEIDVHPVNFSFDDYALKTGEKGSVEAWAGKVRIGQMVVTRTEDKVDVALEMDKDIPAELRQRLK